MTGYLKAALERFNEPATSKRFHLLLMLTWIILIVPTLLFWKDSIPWLVMINIYANVVGHFSAYQSVRAEEAVVENVT